MSHLKIIGIATETSNKNGKAAVDLGLLWEQFFKENIAEKIPNKLDQNIYAIYTDYESNYLGKYTTIIGMQVSTLENIPDGLLGRTFENQNFKKFIAKGFMPNAIVETWKDIWEKDTQLNRSYTYDYELYGENCQKGEDSEVAIFIAVNE